MALLQINKDPSRRTLASFGAMWLVFFGVVAAMVKLRTGSTHLASAIWIVAMAVPAIGWVVPAFMRWAYLAMTYATYPIGFVISHLVLAVTYFGVLAPTGVIMRLCGRDPLRRQLEPEAKTYWLDHTPAETTERYFRQF